MAQQSMTGFGVAHPVSFNPRESKQEDPVDTLPSEKQPPGVDEKEEPKSLDEALTSF